jgi:hypothetical protein
MFDVFDVFAVTEVGRLGATTSSKPLAQLSLCSSLSGCVCVLISCGIGAVGGNAEPRLPVVLWSDFAGGGRTGERLVVGEDISSPQSSSSSAIFEGLREGGVDMLVWAME